ncbi:MAG: hypothetical protein AMXMBFR13_10540 [Phycisphaerae bacterium]
MRPEKQSTWTPVAVGEVSGRIATQLENTALLVLLAVVAMRPLMSETYESELTRIAHASGGAEATTPATTAGFDLAIWGAALATTAAAWRRRRWHLTGLEAGAALMFLGAVISTAVVASNKRLALNASADWLTALALMMVVANLCRDRLRVGLVLAVVIASGAASAAKCVMQAAVEFEETRQHYLQNKAEFWRDVPLDDPRVELYERRMNAAEAYGFMAHSNAQGSLLVLAALTAVAAGAVSQSWVGRAFGFGVGTALALCIPLTGSRGALLAGGVGLVLLIVLWSVGGILRRRWRLTLAGIWLVIGLAVAGVVGFGLVRGGLPGSSLGFRWNYWQVTSRVVAEHFWTGVGALNFDRHYLRYKPIDFPEEIKDPHNFVVAVLAQWGVLGAVGLLAALVGASFVFIRRWGRYPEDSWPAPPRVIDGLRVWLPVTIGAFVLLRLFLMRGLLGSPSGMAAVIFDLGAYGPIWAAVFGLFAWLIAAKGVGRADHIRLVLLCGVAAFLLHNTIDFSLFVPATLTPFAALCGVLLAGGEMERPGEGEAERQRDGGGEGARRAGDKETRRHGDKGTRGQGTETRDEPAAVGRWTLAPVLMAACGAVLLLWLIVWPVTQTSSLLHRARHAANADAADILYNYAALWDSRDPTPLIEIAGLRAMRQTLKDSDLAIAALNEAIARDPLEYSLYQRRAQLYELRYAISRLKSDYWAAISSARQAASLYPHSPDEHLFLAQVLARAAAATGSTEWFAEARVAYETALQIDAARPGTDEVRKWSPERRNRIRQEMESLGPVTSPAPRG